VPRFVHEHSDLVPGGALRLHQVREEALHAAGRGRIVLADVKDAHYFIASRPGGVDGSQGMLPLHAFSGQPNAS
jgi:hypothetical protein